MILNLIDHYFKFLLILLILSPFTYSNHVETQPTSDSFAVEQTRSIALIFSFIQCFPNNSQSLDQPSQNLLQINQNFNPENHLNEYSNLTDITNLISFVQTLEASGTLDNLPFTNAPTDVFNLNLILTVLYHNSDNWPLFYNTSVWLLQRVNMLMIYWALMIVSADKFQNTVTVPSSVEIFPQLFVSKNYVLKAAGLNKRVTPEHPLHYWMSDPGLSNFHVHWHMDNPFWWDESVYGPTRPRKGELFLYMHHQIVCRFNAELLSIGIGEVEPLGLTPDYIIPEGFIPDVVNVNYNDFFTRADGTKLGIYDDGSILIALQNYHARLLKGIDQGFFIGPNGNHVDFQGENGTDILGATIEPSTVHSANIPFYGSFHNFMHRVLAGMLKPLEFPVVGIQAHPETSMRDPVFYRIHKRIDTLFLKYKSTLPAYSQDDLDFPGISVLDLKVLTRSYGNHDIRWRPTSEEVSWPFAEQITTHSPALTTYFKTDKFDISNAARPCRSINEGAVPVDVKILDYVPFWYVFAVQSMRPTVAYGMVRIFIWPERTAEGQLLEGDAAHERAIELDRFRIRIDPGQVSIIKRSSLDSTLTKKEAPVGIKTLYSVRNGSNLLTNPENRRACGFPNNLLLPQGSKEGVPFKLMVYLSDETDTGLNEEDFYPQYPFCGILNGKPFPDARPMGFPFDRPGTRFNITADVESSPVFGCSPMMKNLKEVKVLIKNVN